LCPFKEYKQLHLSHRKTTIVKTETSEHVLTLCNFIIIRNILQLLVGIYTMVKTHHISREFTDVIRITHTKGSHYFREERKSPQLKQAWEKKARKNGFKLVFPMEANYVLSDI